MQQEERICVVLEPGTGEYEEKKSRFIATIRYVDTEEAAQSFISEMKKQYWDARHNCMAYIIGENQPIQRFSDDGEPSGTAGKPILSVLQGAGVTNACIVVTRYFGGVLLGTGGLVRAYQKSAQAALENSLLAEKIHGTRFQIVTDYNGLGKIQYLASNSEVEIVDIQYTDVVTIHIQCEKEKVEGFQKKVMDATVGKAKIQDQMETDILRCCSR